VTPPPCLGRVTPLALQCLNVVDRPSRLRVRRRRRGRGTEVRRRSDVHPASLAVHGEQCGEANTLGKDLAGLVVRVAWSLGKCEHWRDTRIARSKELCPLVARARGKDGGETRSHRWPRALVVLCTHRGVIVRPRCSASEAKNCGSMAPTATKPPHAQVYVS